MLFNMALAYSGVMQSGGDLSEDPENSLKAFDFLLCFIYIINI